MSHEVIRSYNYDMIIPTTFCFVLGLLYYYYKFRSTRNEIRNNDILRNNNITSNNQHDINNNINSDIREDDSLTLHVMIKGNRIQFNIRKDESIANFVNSRIIQHTEIPLHQIDRLKLIFQGRILDLNKKFEEYPNITSDSVLHCYIVNSSQSRSESSHENIRNEGNGRIENNNSILDENSVSVFTLLFHLSILILILLLLFVCKMSSDLISKGALLILKIMIVLWVIQVSKCLAKLAVYRKIAYH